MGDIRPLFEPLKVGKKNFRNRLIMAPMVVHRGVSTAEGQKWYGDRAKKVFQSVAHNGNRDA